MRFGRRGPRADLSLERLIRHRLLSGLVLVFGVLLVLLHITVSTLARNFVGSRLQHDAESLIATLQQVSTEQGNRWQLSETALPLVYQRARSGHYFILRSPEQTLRSRSLWDLDVQSEPLLPGETRISEMAPLADQQWLVWEQGFGRNDTDFTLWIAEDITPLHSIQRQFELYLLGLVVLSIPVLLLWQRMMLQRGFRRLEPLRNALEEQRAGSGVELPQQVPSEVRPLVNAINQRLARSGEQIKRSRTALGNLAHELKRPLQQLHWLADRCADESLRQELEAVHERLFHRIDSELRRARIAGAPMPGQQFVPDQEIPHLVRLLEMGGPRPIRLHSDIPSGALPFDRDDMIELLGNLLDNAWRHARAEVWLKIVREGRGWLISVADDGEGVAPEDLHSLSERGVRLDEQEAGSGHGLGLSICAAVTESYQGTLEFSAADAGGLCVQVRLPG